MRPVPAVGAAATVVYLGQRTEATITAVEDEGRTVVAATHEEELRFTLRRANRRFIREGEPANGGTWLRLER